ncbi:hypothetical protein SAMN05192576_2965 [Nocardioides szechwanensis]|uniref:Gram-positive cocci surface proteins LPxTG domain-containing protein n=2 Tax=Nocardioides szechwanensis TaxID=1005944 RepID=A0A1H0F8W4_9ACTN|nr:hypothetical protein SAMN05192576_2965 [Nocardioides szechwanensis]
MKIVLATAMSIVALAMTWIGASPASAHTPTFRADCAGVQVQATSYDAGQANKWTVTIDGVTQSGTFGSSFSQTFPVPQNGATTSWSASVVGFDGNYQGQDSGTVGPCGTVTPPPPTDVCVDLPGDQPTGTSCTPPPDVVRADSKNLEGCDVVLDGTTYGAGSLTYDEQYTDTFVFNTTTNTWDVVTDTTATITNTEFTPWSVQEQVANGCTEPSTQPPAIQTSESTNDVVCGQDVVVTTTVATTTPYVYDAQTNEWVLGEPQVNTTTSESPVTPEQCETDTGVSPETEENTVVVTNVVTNGVPTKTTTPQVPSFVDAGLTGSDTATPVLSASAATVAAAPSGNSSPMSGLLLLTGAALVLVGGLNPRRS